MYNLIKQCNSGWKMTPFTAKLVSSKLCFYYDVFFVTGTKISQKKDKSVMLSVLAVRIRRSTPRFLATSDVSTSGLAHRALTHLCHQQSVCKSYVSQLELEPRRTSLLHCSFPYNRLVSVQTGLKRESDNKQNEARADTNCCSPFASQHVSCYS